MYARMVNALSATRIGSWFVKHVASPLDPKIFAATNGRFTLTGKPTLPMLTLTVRRGPNLDYLEKEGSPLSSAGLTGTIIGEAIMAVLLFFVAAGLMRGSKGIRLLVAIVQGLTMALAMYVLVVHHVGGYMYRAVVSLFVGVFVLWALYGNEESDEFFNSEWTES